MTEWKSIALSCAIKEMKRAVGLLEAAEAGADRVDLDHVEAYVRAAEDAADGARGHLKRFWSGSGR